MKILRLELATALSEGFLYKVTKKSTNYVFCHPQFSGVIQNIENCCAIRAKFWKFNFWLYKIDYFDNNRHRQTGVKMAQWFSIFWITPLKIVDDKIHYWWNF